MEGYWWPSAAPGWFGDDPVQVGLIIHPGIVLGDRQKAPVTGYFNNIPSEHDGSEDFSFRIYFSEGVTTTAEALRDHVLSASGGVVSSVEAVGGEGGIWAVSVTPRSRGTTVTIEIEADLDCELPGAVCAADGRRLFNRLELIVEAREYNPPMGAPTISGTAEVGEMLTTDTSGISDADGLAGATFSYQWLSYDGSAETDIQGATDSTCTTVSSDEGRAFRVRVSFTDDAGFKESLTSALARSERPYGLTAAVSDGAVVLTWKLPAAWLYSSVYQILRNRPELGEAEPLVYVRYTESGGTAYTDTDVECGVLYVYQVKGVDYFGDTFEASGPAGIRTTEPTPVENSPATGTPAISGAPQAGETLTVDTSGISDTDGLTGATFSYQWVSNDENADTDIQGAIDATYTLVSADEGKAFKVRVSFTDDADNAETLTSAVIAAVAARPNSPATGAPNISGTPHVGETLTASTSVISDPDGMGAASFTYQWLADGANIQGERGSSHTLTEEEEGKAIQVSVSFTDGAGNEETLTSTTTGAVAPRDPPPAPTGLTATLNSDGSITLTWTAPDDGSVTGYQVLRRRPQEGEGELTVYVFDTGSTATTYTDTGTDLDTRYVYRVKARNSAGPSEWTNFARIDK